LINGPDAFTPDGHYALGPVPGLRGFFVAAGGSINGIAGAGGVGKLIAEWILEGEPSIDTHEMNIRRFGPHLKNLDYLTEHCREVYRYYYHLHYPNNENEWGRPLRTSPFYPRLKDLGAVFGEKNGWERVNYLNPGEKWRQAGADQVEWGWGRPAFFDAVDKEVHATREKVAILDMTSFGKIDVTGEGALSFLQTLAISDLDKPVGSLTYTQFLNESGGIESDVTIARLGETHFRVISGTSFVANDIGWIRMHLPQDGSVSVADVTNDLGCLSLFGPRARLVLQSITADDVSSDGFPYMTGRYIDIEGIRVWAQRISYTGELGWEFYFPLEDGLKVFDAVMEKGRAHEISPVGYKALDALRIEKGFLYWSGDITPEDNPLEAGLGFCVSLDKGDFIGRKALLKKKADGLKTKLCAITMDANHHLFGGESVYLNGELVDRIRSSAHGYTIGKDVGMIYLPLDLAVPGTKVDVSVMGKTVEAVVAAMPLVKSAGEGIKG